MLLSICLWSIIYYVQNTLTQVQYANQKVIAMNLAKEGMEAVYAARNARVLAHPWLDEAPSGWSSVSERTKCWLALDSSKCSNDDFSILWTGKYTISFKGEDTLGGEGEAWAKRIDIIFTEHGNDMDFSSTNTDQNIFDKNKPYALYLSWNEWTSEAKNGVNDNLTRYGRFFRKIEGKGIWRKEEGKDDVQLICSSNPSSNPSCIDDSPKEFRFCSVVKYVVLGGTPREERFCWLITNFFSNENRKNTVKE